MLKLGQHRLQELLQAPLPLGNLGLQASAETPTKPEHETLQNLKAEGNSYRIVINWRNHGKLHS